MRLIMGLLPASILAYGASWSGMLVDSRCYASEMSDGNLYPVYADSDMNMRIRQCIPNARTKAFAVVQDDWQGLNLDSAGNSKAAELVHQAATESQLRVTATGKRNKNTIKVDSIVAAR